MQNIKIHNIKELNIEDLNKLVSDNILVTTHALKQAILFESFRSNKIIKFKILVEREFNDLINHKAKDKHEYLIYKSTSNFSQAKLIYENIPKLLPYYNLGIFNIDNYKVHTIINIIEKLKDDLDCSNLKNLNKKIYTFDVNLDYIFNDLHLVEYEEIKFSIENLSSTRVKVNEYLNVEDEILDTLNMISKLIYDGVNIEGIEVYASSEYKSKLQVLSNLYNITTNVDSYYKISSKDQLTIIEALKQKNFDILNLPIDNNVKGEIVKYLNEHLEFLEEDTFIQYTIHRLKDMKITTNKVKNVLQVSSINDFTYNNKFNFILGFNDKDFILYKSDDGYLETEELEKLSLETAIDFNKKQEEKIKNIIKFIKLNSEKNKISYSKNTLKDKVQINNLVNINNFEICKKNLEDENISYCLNSNIYKYKYYLEKSKKENKVYNEVQYLKERIEEKKIRNLSFQFKGKLNWDFQNFKENKNISYTLIEKYYKCNFVFYIENILSIYNKPNNYEAIDLGIYIHDMLELLIEPCSEEKYIEHISEPNDDTQKEYSENIKVNEKLLSDDISVYGTEVLKNNNIFSDYSNSKKKLLIYKINTYLKKLVPIILKQINSEKFKVFSSEEVVLSNLYGYNFIGKIDSVLKHNDKYIVIDYKSGKTNINLDDDMLQLGTNLQNIIYFLLLENKYKKVRFAGSYKYRVTPKMLSSKDTFDSIHKRDGYTNVSVMDVLSNINISNYKSLKKTKEGFSKNSKTLTEEEFENKKNITIAKIKEFINCIEKEKQYNINPLKIKDIDACKNCSYYQICYNHS